MIKDGEPYIVHDGNEHRCYLAGYYNPVQHKWHFVIDGVDSDIRYQEHIKFMDMWLKVTYSERRQAVITKPFNNVSGQETYIEARRI